jgi:large subunit ribosomal protein L4
VSKRVKKLAFLKALSARILGGDVLVTDEIAVTEPKTKNFVKLLQSLTEEERVLVIANQYSPETYRAARNVRPVLLNTVGEVNTEQLLAFRKIIVTKDALTKLSERVS